VGGGGLCNAAGASPVTPAACSVTANAPSPLRGVGCTLDLLSCDLVGLGGGARPVGRHPRHCWRHGCRPRAYKLHSGRCGNGSGAAERTGTGRRLVCHHAPYGPTSAAPSSLSEDITAIHRPSTLESATVRVRDRP
jgi:hypothetical protein